MYKKYYKLHHDKKNCEISISELSGDSCYVKNRNKFLEQDIIYLSDYNFMGKNLESLKELAKQMQSKWIAELEYKIKTIKGLKI